MNDYQQFLETKIELPHPTSALAQDAQLDPSLFPHQRDVVCWALNRQRALIAASFGLGKTRIAISIAKVLHEATGDPFLIVCPLGVKHQFAEEDGPPMGVTWEYVRTDDELQDAAQRTPYLITNYERVRDGQIDPRKIDCAASHWTKGVLSGRSEAKHIRFFRMLSPRHPIASSARRRHHPTITVS